MNENLNKESVHNKHILLQLQWIPYLTVIFDVKSLTNGIF